MVTQAVEQAGIQAGTEMFWKILKENIHLPVDELCSDDKCLFRNDLLAST